MGLREQATLDARAILEDTSGFAWPVTLTSPAGVATSLQGFTTDIGQTIDPETGVAVAGRRASVAVARASLPTLPEAIADRSRKPWIASFADSRGVIGRWKVVEVLPDSAIGLVVLLLEIYELATIKLTGALALPSGLQVAGTIAPEVSLGGALVLPAGLQVAGAIAPEVSLGGALVLPGGLQLSGAFTVDPSPIKRWYRLALSTPNAGEYDNWVEVYGGGPIVQTDADRKPAAATSGNGLPVATFDGTDVMLIPLDASGTGNNGTSQWWCAFRFKPAGLNSSQSFWSWTSAIGTAPNKLGLGFTNDGTGKITFTVFVSGFNGRIYSSSGVVIDGAWNHIYVQFDGTRTAEFDPDGLTADAKVRMFLGNTALALTAINTGSGGTVTALLSAFGTGGLGAGNDSDTPSGPLRNGSQVGGNLQFGLAPLSTAQLAAIVNFEIP